MKTIILTVTPIEATQHEDANGQREEVLVQRVEDSRLKGARLPVVEIPSHQDGTAGDRNRGQVEELHELERKDKDEKRLERRKRKKKRKKKKLTHNQTLQ